MFAVFWALLGPVLGPYGSDGSDLVVHANDALEICPRNVEPSLLRHIVLSDSVIEFVLENTSNHRLFLVFLCFSWCFTSFG